MKHAIRLSLGLVIACSLVACSGQKVKGNGVILSQARSLPAFNKISVEGPFTLVVDRKSPSNVEVTGDSNLQQYVTTIVENNTLEIYTQKGFNLQPTGPIMIQVATKDLEQIAAKGNCIVTAADLNTNNFEFDTKGSCQAMLSGRVDTAKYVVDGATRLDAKSLQAKQTQMDVKGAAQASVYATQKLEVKITGAGQVTYYGKPPVINQAIFGGGELNKGA